MVQLQKILCSSICCCSSLDALLESRKLEFFHYFAWLSFDSVLNSDILILILAIFNFCCFIWDFFRF